MSPPPRPPIICYDLTSSGNGSLPSRRRIVESTTIPTARARRITPAVTYKTYNVPPTIITPIASYQRYTPASTVTAHEINPPTTATTTTTTIGNNGLSSLSGRSSISNATTRLHPTNSHRTATYNTRPYHTSASSGSTTSSNRPSTICCSSSNNNNNRNKYDRLAHISLDENCSAFSHNERISSNQARHAYGQKLKVEQAQKQRQRHHDLHHRTMIEQLEKIQEQLNALKRNHGAVYNTYGMAHSAAKYIRQQDEEYERLRQKVDQFAETRARELTRQARLAKQYHGLLKEEDQRLDVERRLRDVSNMPPSRKLSHRPMDFSPSPVKSRRPHSLSSSTNSTPPSTMTNSPPNSQESSSTISISTCSSPVSTTIDQLQQQQQPPPQQQRTPRNHSHLVKSPHLPFRTPPSTMPKMKLNPFPQDTLEVTDIEFFSKIEDQTMMEVNKMMNRLQSTMRDFNLNDAHSPSYHLGSSQVDHHYHENHYQQQQQQLLLDHYHQQEADEMADCEGAATSVVM